MVGLAERLWKYAQGWSRKAQKMTEETAEFSGFAITIQAGDECLLVPGEHAIVGAKGIFVRDRQLGVGTPVVVHVWKNQTALSMLGVVCANYKDLGFAIQFTETTGSAALQLATLLAAESVSSAAA
jgi:hypothetical protein